MNQSNQKSINEIICLLMFCIHVWVFILLFISDNTFFCKPGECQNLVTTFIFSSLWNLYMPCWYACVHKIGVDLFIIIPKILMEVINHVVTYTRTDGQWKIKTQCFLFPLHMFIFSYIMKQSKFLSLKWISISSNLKSFF